MANRRTLEVILAGDDRQLQGTLTSANGALGSFGRGIGNVSRIAGAAMLGIGVAAAGGVAASLNAVGSFEDGMREVFTLVPGATQEAMDAMTGNVKDFAVEFGVLPNEVIPALYQSISAGVPTDNVFEFLETAQMAAKGGVTDLTTAVDGISSVVNAYGTDVIGASEASDLMFTAVRLGKTNFEELSSSLFNVTPIAAAMGVSFEEVTAGVAALTAQGTPTSVATTQMRAAIAELGTAGSKAATAFGEFTEGGTFQGFLEGGGTLEEALQILAQGADESGQSLTEVFGSIEAAQAAMALTGSDAFSDALAEMGESAGATQTAFETMDTGMNASFDRIKARVQVGLINFGERIAPAFEKGLDRGLELFDEFAPKVEEVFAQIIPVAAEIAGTAIEKLQEWWPRIQEAFELVADYAEEHWPEVRDIIVSAVETISAVVEGIVEFLTLLWEQFGDDIMAFAERVWPPLQDFIEATMQAIQAAIEIVLGIITLDFGHAWDGIKDLTGAAWDALKASIGIAIAAIQLVLEAGWGLIKDFAAGIWADIGDNITAVWDSITGAIGTARTAVQDALTVAWETIAGATAAAWDGITGTVTGAVNGAIETIAGIPGRIAGFASGLFTAVGNAARDTADDVIGFIAGIPDRIIELHAAVGTAAFDLGAKIISSITEGVSGIAGLATDFAQAFASAVRNVINVHVIDRINDALEFSVSSGPLGKLPGIPDNIHFNPPDIPHLATGHVAYEPLLALIGENPFNTPEIVAPEQTLRKIFREEGAAGIGGGSVQVIFPHGTIVKDLTEEALARQLQRADLLVRTAGD